MKYECIVIITKKSVNRHRLLTAQPNPFLRRHEQILVPNRERQVEWWEVLYYPLLRRDPRRGRRPCRLHCPPTYLSPGCMSPLTGQTSCHLSQNKTRWSDLRQNIISHNICCLPKDKKKNASYWPGFILLITWPLFCLLSLALFQAISERPDYKPPSTGLTVSHLKVSSSAHLL